MDRDAFLHAQAAAPDDDGLALVRADWEDEEGNAAAAADLRLGVALKLVIAAPADDGPRLAYAKICDDYGRRDRAEFIRLQIRISALGLPDGPCEPACRCGGIGKRAAQLIAEFGDRWNAPLPGEVTGAFSFTWRRGFVEFASLSWELWLAHAAEMRAAQPVTRVRLTTRPEWVAGHLDVPHNFRFLGCESSAVVEIGHPDFYPRLLAAEWPGIEFDVVSARPQRGELITLPRGVQYAHLLEFGMRRPAIPPRPVPLGIPARPDRCEYCPAPATRWAEMPVIGLRVWCDDHAPPWALPIEDLTPGRPRVTE